MNIALVNQLDNRFTPHHASGLAASRQEPPLGESGSVAPGAGATSGHRTTCLLPATPRRRFGRRWAAIGLLSATALSACDDEAKVAVCDVRGDWVFRATLNDGGTERPAPRGETVEFRIDGELGSESAIVTNSVGDCGCNAPSLIVDRDRCTYQLTFWDGGELDGECDPVSSRFELTESTSNASDSSSGWLYADFNEGCSPPDHPERVTYMAGGRR